LPLLGARATKWETGDGRLAAGTEAYLQFRQNGGADRARFIAATWVCASIVATGFLLSWPTLLNGGPFFMSDTISYIRGAASAFYRAAGLKSAWTSEYFRLFGDAVSRPGMTASAAAPNMPVILSGRSVYYGALLFLGDFAGSLWTVVAIQSTLGAITIVLSAKNIAGIMGRQLSWEGLAVGALAAMATPLAYFTGYLMPDVFGGFALLAGANLLFAEAAQTRLVRVYWMGLLAYALVVHNANPPILVVMTLAGLTYARRHAIKLRASELIAIAACVCLAGLAQLTFSYAVRTLTGAPPLEPPFLAARLIADGPGYLYLERHCSSEGYIYCRTLRAGRLSSDTLLWDENPNRSLFKGLSPQEQRLSASQQRKFVIAVAEENPLWVFTTAAENGLRQFFDFRLAEFNYGDVGRQRFSQTIPPPLLGSLTTTRAFRDTMPVQPIEITSACSTLLSLLLLAFLLGGGEGKAIYNRDAIRAYCVAVIAGLAANAFICGVISGPHGRYQMRVVWILPVIAASVLASRARGRHHPLGAVTVADWQRRDGGGGGPLHRAQSSDCALRTSLGKSG